MAETKLTPMLTGRASRRHPNADAHFAARDAYREKHNRVKKALARQDARALRTPAQQLARLDKLLGEGVGAVRERARLQAEIDSH